MNKTEMTDRLAARTGLSKGAAKDAVDGVFAIIGEALVDGEEVRLPGFGTFGTRSRPGPYRTQPEERRGRFDTGVHFADVQGGEDAEGHREWGSGIVTVRPEKTAPGSASSRLNMEPARLLYDDGNPARCRGGAGKTEESRGVDGLSATGLDAASRMRQESSCLNYFSALTAGSASSSTDS